MLWYFSCFEELRLRESVEVPKKACLAWGNGMTWFVNSLKFVLTLVPMSLRQLKSNFLCVVFPLGIFSLFFPFPTLWAQWLLLSFPHGGHQSRFLCPRPLSLPSPHVTLPTPNNLLVVLPAPTPLALCPPIPGYSWAHSLPKQLVQGGQPPRC